MDVVALFGFVVPGIWPFILLTGSIAILHYGWKLYCHWHNSLTPHQKWTLNL